MRRIRRRSVVANEMLVQEAMRNVELNLSIEEEITEEKRIAELHEHTGKLEELEEAIQDFSDLNSDVITTMSVNEKITNDPDMLAPPQNEIISNQEALIEKIEFCGLELPEKYAVNTESLDNNVYAYLRTNNEGLSDIFRKIGEGLKKIWEAIKKFFAKIWKWFKSFLPTKRNKLVKLQNRLKEAGVSKVHEDEQDNFDELVDDSYKSLVRMANGSVSGMTTIIDEIISNSEANTTYLERIANVINDRLESFEKLINFQVQIEQAEAQVEAQNTGTETDLNIRQSGGNHTVTLAPEMQDSQPNSTKIMYADLLGKYRGLIQLADYSSVMQSSIDNCIGGIKLDTNEDVKQNFNSSTGTIKSAKAMTIKPSGEDVNVGILVTYTHKGAENDALTDEQTLKMVDKLYEFKTVTFDIKGKKDKVELSKSDASSLVKSYLDNLTKIEKVTEKLNGKLDKMISRMEKAIDKFELDKDTKTNNPNAKELVNFVKKHLRHAVTVSQKLTSEVVVSYSTTLNSIYDFGTVYAAYVLKGIKHTEVEKENNK